MELDDIRKLFREITKSLDNHLTQYSQRTPDFVNGILVPKDVPFEEVYELVNNNAEKVITMYLDEMMDNVNMMKKAQENFIIGLIQRSEK